MTTTIKLQSSENCSAFLLGLPKICRLTTYSSKSKTSIMAANLAKFLSCCTRYNNVGCQCGRLREVERICRHQSRITPDKRKQRGGTLHASVSVNNNSWWALIRRRKICWLFPDLLLNEKQSMFTFHLAFFAGQWYFFLNFQPLSAFGWILNARHLTTNSLTFHWLWQYQRVSRLFKKFPDFSLTFKYFRFSLPVAILILLLIILLLF